MMINIEEVKRFWKWFRSHHSELIDNLENDDVIKDLDQRIAAMGNFAWEIGPGLKVENQLVISPGSDPELLPYTKEIVSHSIALPNWEYHYAKPPKQWEMKFEYELQSGDVVEVDASKWHYVLLKYDDGMYEIIVEWVDLEEQNEDDLITIGEILIEGILGEEKRIILVYAIEMVNEFPYEYKNKSQSIKTLSDNI